MKRPQFTTLLATTVVGVYLLVVAGATATVADATAACTSWPLCAPSSVSAVVALGHRTAALVVGLLLVSSVAIGWSDSSRRVKGALLAALALYPVQVGMGAVVVFAGASGLTPGLHLGVAVAIFTALTAALAWQLEADTGRDDVPEEPFEESVVDAEPSESTVRFDSSFDRARATLFAYFRLMKPRLMWLLALVAAAGMSLAGGPGGLTVRTIVLTLGGGVLAIGASGTFNHVLERDIDRRMKRTSDRPLATELVPVRNALAFGFALAAASLVAFLQVNVFAATLGFVAIVFYSVIYTLVLKPNTVQNTVIGGVAGALPALIGWVGVTGEIGLPGVVLAVTIFLWTPAHFYNLALAYKDDYARGGFPMMPVVSGETKTRKHIVWYLAATLASAGVLTAVSDLGVFYAVTTVGFGALFLGMVVRLHRERTEGAAFRAFHASNAYLGALLVAIVVDSLVV
ncbi:protoheme IX farnesyltransferase [Halosegnis rubeus]|uniref:Protoheme IX farnesyltransferase n=1 Tax=Halosegnis rubeus TaxID=2212850 RepID=A0A5N5U8I2_9EURY|nr:heme o synthase [Halosegnis rubeus]KAB7514935.1 protoheme IX farnesyltransferase [Halosegnis rubeus]